MKIHFGCLQDLQSFHEHHVLNVLNVLNQLCAKWLAVAGSHHFNQLVNECDMPTRSESVWQIVELKCLQFVRRTPNTSLHTSVHTLTVFLDALVVSIVSSYETKHFAVRQLEKSSCVIHLHEYDSHQIYSKEKPRSPPHNTSPQG